MTRCPEQQGVASYVLGVLDAGDDRRMQAHLPTCEHCRAELADLEDLPGLLARVLDADLAPRDYAPSDLAFQRLRRAAEGRRLRSRTRLLVGAAAAAVALAVGGGVGLTSLLQDETGRGTRTSVVSAASGSVEGRATVTAVPTGSQVGLSLSGVAEGLRCRLVAVGSDGQQETASTWTVNYRGEVTVTGSLSLAPSQIDRLVVETLDGRRLLTLPAPVA